MSRIIKNRDTVIVESGKRQYIDIVSNVISPEIYADITEITPNKETQVLPTGGKMLLENVIVNPIPDNYGLITWNGSFLTVS